MPLWRIFAHPSTFTYEQREGLAKAVTALYANRGLPAFYVNVIFIDVKEDQVWIGGKPKSNFVRIAIEQIARTMANPDTEEGRKVRTRWMDLINEVLKPFIIDRPELEWEHHIYETPRDLWRVQGMDPPPSFSQAEKLWVTENKPLPYDHLLEGLP